MDPKKKNNPFEYIFRFQFAKTVVAKCLKLISNHSGIISGTYFSSFQGSLTQQEAQEGSEYIFWPNFLIFNDSPQILLIF